MVVDSHTVFERVARKLRFKFDRFLDYGVKRVVRDLSVDVGFKNNVCHVLPRCGDFTSRPDTSEGILKDIDHAALQDFAVQIQVDL